MGNNYISFESIDTPILLLNLEQLEKNIKEMTQLSIEAGVRLRPHTKVHESSFIAKLQVDAGACGIEVGTVDRAKPMIDAGIEDILIAHPFYSKTKLEMLKNLLKSHKIKITLVVDMIEQAQQINDMGRQISKRIHLLLKVALSKKLNRFGVPLGVSVLELSKMIAKLPYIQFDGIYAHEIGFGSTEEGVNKAAFESALIMEKFARLLKSEGVNVVHVSVGSSPTFRTTCQYLKKNKFSEITEIHPGNCVIGDIWHTKNLGNKIENCAATMLTTVISTAHADHFVIDAGYKSLGNDSLIFYRENPDFFWNGKPRFGSIKGRMDLWLGSVSAETACIYYLDKNIGKNKKLKLGERLEIIPNNITLTVSLQKEIYGIRNCVLERIIPLHQ